MLTKSTGSKVLYLHCFSGVSGDMLLGALLDLELVPLKDLERELTKTGLKGYTLECEKTSKKGIAGTRFLVMENKEETPPLRNLSSLLKIVGSSSLEEDIKTNASQIFKKLAEAEARVHGVKVEEVHFHEIGAVDTVVDILGTLIMLKLMEVKTIISSPLHLGAGFIQGEHGTLPLPAPATLELLKGVPVYSRGVEGELATPTGAVLLSSLVSSFGPLPAGKIAASGYGAGTRDLEHPNLLRAVLLEESPADRQRPDQESETPPGEVSREPAPIPGPEGFPEGDNGLDREVFREKVLVVEANIDDMSPEVFPWVMDKLLQSGAWDVFFTPIHMKKNRPGIKLSFLCAPHLLDCLTAIVFRETSSLGLRVLKGDKYYLPRRKIEVETPLGKVGIKVGYLEGKINTWAPEYEDCFKIARERKVPLKDVYREAEKSFREKYGD